MERRIDPLSVTYCRATHDRVHHSDYQRWLSLESLASLRSLLLALKLNAARSFQSCRVAFGAARELRWIAPLPNASAALIAGR